MTESVNCRLLTVGEACKMLNLPYHTFHRVMVAECFDVVMATGKTLVTEQSVVEFSQGLRQPSEASVVARRERAERMRAEYRNPLFTMSLKSE